jgi:glucosylceramidase
MIRSSHRSFRNSKLVALYLAGLLAAGGLRADAQETARPRWHQAEKDNGMIRPLTSARTDDGTNTNAIESEAAAVVTIDTTKKYQTINGFGGAFTEAACCVFSKMPPGKRQELFQQLFGQGGDSLGLNLCRTCIGSSDYATKIYSYDDGRPDPELKRFSIAPDRAYVLPMLKEALAINPDIFLFASPWSPPGWMKANNSMLGGSMRRKYMESYAHYFAKYLSAYKAEGISIKAVTVQNEVDTEQDGRMPACAWPQEYEVDFVRLYLGPLFKKEGIKTQIWIIDHNFNLWGRALSSLELPDFRSFVSAVAWHGYVGEAFRMSTVHEAYPQFAAYWTEGGPDISDPNYRTDWCKWARTFSENLNNWASGITVWNLALNEKGKPNIGPFPCGGLVTINSRDNALTLSGQYKALSHFSRFIESGAVRVDSRVESGTDSEANKDASRSMSKVNLNALACLNNDGSKVLVLTNSGAACKVTIREGTRSCSVALPANSLETLVWN